MKGTHVRVVEPSANDEKSSEVPTVLVRDDIVWIVAACAKNLKRTENSVPGCRDPGGNGSISFLRIPCDSFQKVVDIFFGE